MYRRTLSLLFVVVICLPGAARGSSITLFSMWSLVEDPPHAGMSASVDSDSQVTLEATGAISSGTDIGFASVNGGEVDDSTSGYYFSPESDFSIAVDFDVSFLNQMGAGAIGLGVGEETIGANSAGVALGFANNSPLSFATSGRIGNIDQDITGVPAAPATSGRFFVDYDGVSREFSVGVGAAGAAAPSHAPVVASVLQSDWNDKPLLVSFFLRSQEIPLLLLSELTSGDVTAVFSNFEVLSGTPIQVPEPGALVATVLALVASRLSRRHARG